MRSLGLTASAWVLTHLRLNSPISPNGTGLKPAKCAGLRVASVLRLHRLVTVTTHSLVRQLGELSRAWRKEVDDKLARLFGLAT